MAVYYYFLIDSTGHEIIHPAAYFMGDIGDTITISDETYTIDDYAIEYIPII